MQPGCKDFYGDYLGEGEYGGGCCLLCHSEEKREGCLCFNCKCSKCYWYSPGGCDKVEKLKEKRGNKIISFKKN